MRALDTQARLGRMEGILERIDKLKARKRSGDEPTTSQQYGGGNRG